MRAAGTYARGGRVPWSKLDEAKVSEARAAYAAGATCPELAARYGVGNSAMLLALRGDTWRHCGPGLPTGGRQRRGEAHPNARLTAAKAREARELYAAGEGMSAIAAHLGVTTGCVGPVLLGKTWKHAGGPVAGVRASRARGRRKAEGATP